MDESRCPCGRRLTDPVSVAAGIGPVCRRKLTPTTGAPSRPAPPRTAPGAGQLPLDLDEDTAADVQPAAPAPPPRRTRPRRARDRRRPRLLRCEQCGRVGSRGFRVIPPTVHTPEITVCAAENACRRRRPRSGPQEPR
ncbi:DUF6011 domain-containing protein [Streptomyces synnematoformans]|uniref:DUF6011 domain-containing protein n=1 Tax=Streptomyces synnematoformans TaxID=415721 RepID=UPI0031D66B5D